MQSINVYGFINGTERMVFAAESLEDALQLAFHNSENADAFLQFDPTQEEIDYLMAGSRTGTLH